MALPKNIRPEYSTTIPSNGRKIKYQPFSVKEEKVLIIAAESNNPDEVTNAVTNVLQSCVTSPADFKVEDLALFDVEYLFLKTRSKSIGEKVKVEVRDPDDETCVVKTEINIDKIGVEKTEGHDPLIKLNDDVTVKMRYPDITFFNDGINLDSIAASIGLVARCVSQIIIEEEVYNRADMTDEEIEEWIESLTTSQLNKIMEFFVTMPKLRHTVTLKNPKTNKNFSVKLEGLQDFF